MRNPWRMQDGPNNQINRNNFPMSFQYNGTFKYGKIYPIGLWRTIPGASYQIDSTLALNFMPTVFPIQTRQRAYVHFFYGRDRNFWKDYKDFVNGMNPELVKPYIDESVTKARTGNLLDYLGVPTTIVGSYGNYTDFNFDLEYKNDGGLSLPYFVSGITSNFRFSGFQAYNIYVPFSNIQTCFNDYGSDALETPPSLNKNLSDLVLTDPRGVTDLGFILGYPVNLSGLSVDSVKIKLVFSDSLGVDINTWLDSPFNDTEIYRSELFNKRKDMFGLGLYDSNGNLIKYIYHPTITNQGELQFDTDTINDVSKIIVFCNMSILMRSTSNSNDYVRIFDSSNNTLLVYPNKISVKSSNSSSVSIVKDIDETTTPYWGSGHETDLRTRIKLSAIPCRFYETVYNLYYRNPQNNPYILNGKPEYNIFIPTKDGGVDTNLYELRYRNWEDDFLTTAVQTPQQGIAPLVGLTDRGATVTLTNEDGSVTRYKTNLDEYGNVTGIETTDSSEPLLTQALIDAVSYGISIEDLRNVNAMQKWLELNLRKGYQYKDIIEARWGISISYNELDLPEFIGGFTQEIGLQAVTQTATTSDTIEGSLGWQAGRMYASGSGRQITHYCDEEGYIMALLTVVPVPNYSQLLPKHWFTRDLLDSYQPEFNHIGFQPITYKEVCPIQAFQESTENVDVLEQTFGYQRPWYEYFNQVDEVHGQFRTTFKDFLINRTFNVKPELSESFLLVDPNQVNDVFAVQTDDDKIIGAIEHRITAKLPISLYAQARLE